MRKSTIVLCSDLGLNIKGYETGMIPSMLVMIKVKKAIDLMPVHEKKEDFIDKK